MVGRSFHAHRSDQSVSSSLWPPSFRLWWIHQFLAVWKDGLSVLDSWLRGWGGVHVARATCSHLLTPVRTWLPWSGRSFLTRTILISSGPLMAFVFPVVSVVSSSFSTSAPSDSSRQIVPHRLPLYERVPGGISGCLDFFLSSVPGPGFYGFNTSVSCFPTPYDYDRFHPSCRIRPPLPF